MNPSRGKKKKKDTPLDEYKCINNNFQVLFKSSGINE